PLVRPSAGVPKGTGGLRAATPGETMKKRLVLTAFLIVQYASAFGAPISIVLRPGATAVDKLAAQELSAYLEQMGNAKPAVVSTPAIGEIYLGTLPFDIDGSTRGAIMNSLAGKDHDSFVLRSV